MPLKNGLGGQKILTSIKSELSALPKPIMGLSVQSSLNHSENFDFKECLALCHSILDRTNGTIVILDPKSSAPGIHSFRVRYLEDWKKLRGFSLESILKQSDLFIGAHGPAMESARRLSIRGIGLWKQKHPS